MLHRGAGGAELEDKGAAAVLTAAPLPLRRGDFLILFGFGLGGLNSHLQLDHKIRS